MVKKTQSSVSTIKSKLIAAVAMLLVGVFMVVSSSYAWFTLSTAPEVTGIYTSVGSNGNLEMALVPESGNLSDIGNGVGMSGNNNAWGNLVDLGQTTANQNNYGLNSIQLMPSRLDLMASQNELYDYALNGAGLLAPKYGADGRVDSLVSTLTGKYNSSSAAFDQDAEASGVVAIGTASGMTPQQTYWLQAKKNVNSKLVSAQNHADASFENYDPTHGYEDEDAEGNPITVYRSYGEMLANVIMARAIDGDSAVCDIRFVPGMVAELEAANADLKLAMEAYIAALAAVALQDSDAAAWTAAVAEIEAIDVDNIVDNKITVAGYKIDLSVDTRFVTVLGKYTAIKAILTYVDAQFTAFTGDPQAATWAETSAILFTDVDGKGKFVDYNEVTLNGNTPEYIKTDIIAGNATAENEKLVEFGMDFMANGIVDFTTGSGVHADLAEVVGEYQSEINVTINYGSSSMTAKNVKLRAVMDSGVEVKNLYKALTVQPTSSGGAADSNPITDVFGYKIDFAFRTNAVGSNLMLQTSAAGRIYEDGGIDETMGHGSTMTFAILDETFTQAQAKALMTAVRIVFVDAEGNVVAIGLLEQDTADATGYEISANGEITSEITLYDFTIAEDGKFDPVSETAPDSDGKTKLMALTQNEATQLSVLVYLDGDVVDNTMVSAGTIASIAGSLNLQFSSSADLTPMDYEEFKNAN